MSEYVDPGVFQVDVDYARVRPHVDFGLFDDYDSVFGNFFSPSDVFVSPLSVYHMYLVTRAGHCPPYVMRLPSQVKSLDLPSVSLSVQWLTFSGVSILAVLVETSGSDEQVTECVREIAQWLERAASYSNVLNLPDASPNVATVLCCKDKPLLQAPGYMDNSGMPNWRVSLSSFHQDATFLFQADVAPTSVGLPVPADVQHMLGNLHVHALHSLFPSVERMHFEKRPPTPVKGVELQAGDVVVYLSADQTSLVYAQVVGTDMQQSYWLQLHNAEKPECLAKFDTGNQVLESPLQVLNAFRAVSKSQ